MQQAHEVLVNLAAAAAQARPRAPARHKPAVAQKAFRARPQAVDRRTLHFRPPLLAGSNHRLPLLGSNRLSSACLSTTQSSLSAARADDQHRQRPRLGWSSSDVAEPSRCLSVSEGVHSSATAATSACLLPASASLVTRVACGLMGARAPAPHASSPPDSGMSPLCLRGRSATIVQQHQLQASRPATGAFRSSPRCLSLPTTEAHERSRRKACCPDHRGGMEAAQRRQAGRPQAAPPSTVAAHPSGELGIPLFGLQARALGAASGCAQTDVPAILQAQNESLRYFSSVHIHTSSPPCQRPQRGPRAGLRPGSCPDARAAVAAVPARPRPPQGCHTGSTMIHCTRPHLWLTQWSSVAHPLARLASSTHRRGCRHLAPTRFHTQSSQRAQSSVRRLGKVRAVLVCLI